MVVFVRVSVSFDDDEWRDAIFGSGCLSYPWWSDVQRETRPVKRNGVPIGEQTVWIVEGNNPDDPQGMPVTGVLTLPDLAEAASAIVTEARFAGSVTLARQIVERDLDADGADMILQRAVFGDVIYG